MSDEQPGVPARDDASGSRKGAVVGVAVAVVMLLVGAAVLGFIVLGGGEPEEAGPGAAETATTATPAPPGTDATETTEQTGGTGATGSATTEPAVPLDTPTAVVDAFLAAVSIGDCPAATELVTEAFLAANGTCDEGMPAEFTWVIGEESVDEQAERASVVITLTTEEFAEDATVKLLVEDGGWKIATVE